MGDDNKLYKPTLQLDFDVIYNDIARPQKEPNDAQKDVVNNEMNENDNIKQQQSQCTNDETSNNAKIEETDNKESMDKNAVIDDESNEKLMDSSTEKTEDAILQNEDKQSIDNDGEIVSKKECNEEQQSSESLKEDGIQNETDAIEKTEISMNDDKNNDVTMSSAESTEQTKESLP